MSFTSTPTLSAFWRSMLRRIWGVAAEKVVKTWSRLGFWLAAIVIAPATEARSAGDFPLRSSSSYWKPEPVPRPMIGGMLIGRICASRMPAVLSRTSRRMSKTDRFGPRRSANGFRVTIRKPELDSARLSMKLRPITAVMLATPGTACVISPTCSTTLWVRLRAAAAGRLICTKNRPWSSSGRKPPGTVLSSQYAPPPNTATRSSDRAATRTRRRTMLPYPSLMRSIKALTFPMARL